MNNMYFNKQGKPIGLMTWAQLLEERNYKIVEQTELKNGKWVSTVWLGLNHNWEDGPPLIFETMVFSKRGDYGTEEDCERYSTLEEAIKGHKKLVKKYDTKK